MQYQIRRTSILLRIDELVMGLSHKRKINAVRQPLNFSIMEYKLKKRIKSIYYEMLQSPRYFFSVSVPLCCLYLGADTHSERLRGDVNSVEHFACDAFCILYNHLYIIAHCRSRFERCVPCCICRSHGIPIRFGRFLVIERIGIAACTAACCALDGNLLADFGISGHYFRLVDQRTINFYSEGFFLCSAVCIQDALSVV